MLLINRFHKRGVPVGHVEATSDSAVVTGLVRKGDCFQVISSDGMKDAGVYIAYGPGRLERLSPKQLNSKFSLHAERLAARWREHRAIGEAAHAMKQQLI